MSPGIGARPTATMPDSPRSRADPPGGSRPSGGPVAEAVPLGALLQRAAAAVRTGIPDAAWVVAAVTAVKPARGGHSVELAEPDRPRAEAGMLRTYLPDAVVEALGRSAGRAVAAADLSGMTVVVRVAVELHPRWGLSGRVLALGPGIEASLARLAVEASAARLRREGLLDRQRGIPAPRDVTRVAVVHPPSAAGWLDIAAELSRWAAAGLVAVRSRPVPFEGPRAAAGIAAAVRLAAEPLEGHTPDVMLVVRGGGAAASLGALDDEALARAIAAAPMPVVCGLGHASDGKTLADRAAWMSVDTPSKALALMRTLMSGPARQARADHRAVLAAAAAGVDHARPRLAALERLATAAALRRTVASAQDLDRGWAAVREAAEATRGRLARLGDGLDRVAADVAAASPLVLARTTAELAELMEAVRSRARRAPTGMDGGASLLASVVARSQAGIAAAQADVAARGRALQILAGARLDRADDGARALAAVEAAVFEAHRRRSIALDRSWREVQATVARGIDAAAAGLDRHAASLDGADPAHVLRRGYALVADGSGRPVTSAAAARAAAALTITFADGTLAVAHLGPVIEKEERHEEQHEPGPGQHRNLRHRLCPA